MPVLNFFFQRRASRACDRANLAWSEPSRLKIVSLLRLRPRRVANFAGLLPRATLDGAQTADFGEARAQNLANTELIGARYARPN
jgi:hypothetical protein